MSDKTKDYNMIDEFHVMYMYRKIQAKVVTTDLKNLEQLLKTFRQVVAERREEYYQEIGEGKAKKLNKKNTEYNKIYHKLKIGISDYLFSL